MRKLTIIVLLFIMCLVGCSAKTKTYYITRNDCMTVQIDFTSDTYTFVESVPFVIKEGDVECVRGEVIKGKEYTELLETVKSVSTYTLIKESEGFLMYSKADSDGNVEYVAINMLDSTTGIKLTSNVSDLAIIYVLNYIKIKIPE